MKFKLILFSILAIPIMLSGCGKADIKEKYQITNIFDKKR